MLIGCSDKELETFDAPGNYTSSVVSPGGIAGNVTVTNSEIIVPIKVTLNLPASRAFDVEIQLNNAKVEEQIASGDLDNAIVIPYSDLMTPNVVSIPFGAKEAEFSVKINRTVLEKGYGKRAVFGYNLKNAGKGNTTKLDEWEKVEIDVASILDINDLHYISIFNGEGRIITAANRRNYTSTAAGLSIPLTASLASFPGRTFTVDIIRNQEIIQSMIEDEQLPENTVELPASEYSFTNKLTFPSNTSRVDFELSVSWNIISKYEGKKIAICLELTNPSLHILDPEKKIIVAVIDPSSVLESDVTNLGVLSVSRDHTGGPNNAEGSSKLVDNNVNTKFYQANFVGDLWFQLEFPTPQKIGSYSITSANNLPNRDPKEWNLVGSNDGLNWTVLDTQGPILFANRYMVKRFEIAMPREFRYYRLNITANVGESGFQVAEWRLISIP